MANHGPNYFNIYYLRRENHVGTRINPGNKDYEATKLINYYLIKWKNLLVEEVTWEDVLFM